MIELKNVSFSYDGQREGTIENVNLTVKKGECVLLCGRSGCGKTTVTRLINGLIPNFFSGRLDGEVLLDGENVSAFPMYELAKKVGSVFQNPRTQFFNVDTDGEIAFGMENEALPPPELKDRVARAAQELHIQNLLGRSIFELSGGEKQKIAFASVYAMNPAVFLLDEPSSNLDAASVLELKDRLRLLKSQGKTILIAEHRLYYLMDLADRIVYLEQGRIAGIYTPQEFLELSNEKRASMGLRAAALRQSSCADKRHIPGDMALRLENVSLGYRKKEVLCRLSVGVARGEIVAVAGHNGAGKTTFLRGLCGLQKESAGRFVWNGSGLGPKARQKKSYLVMQDVGYELFAESVEKECIFGIKRPDKCLAEETLKGLGLFPLRDRHPGTLSGGQKQRLAVAVSMICKKEILVFDEPTSGLDYDSMLQVAGMLERLARAGKVIFVVTHDYELICKACSRILLFREGRLAEDMEVSAENGKRIRSLWPA